MYDRLGFQLPIKRVGEILEKMGMGLYLITRCSVLASLFWITSELQDRQLDQAIRMTSSIWCRFQTPRQHQQGGISGSLGEWSAIMRSANPKGEIG